MLRGSLDYVDERRVAGWVFSSEVDLANRTVLAFVGARCIGSGPVSIHRPDLAAAGLGNGTAGFGFPVSIPSSAAAEDVYVKLEESDLILPPKAWLGCQQ